MQPLREALALAPPPPSSPQPSQLRPQEASSAQLPLPPPPAPLALPPPRPSSVRRGPPLLPEACSLPLPLGGPLGLLPLPPSLPRSASIQLLLLPPQASDVSVLTLFLFVSFGSDCLPPTQPHLPASASPQLSTLDTNLIPSPSDTPFSVAVGGGFSFNSAATGSPGLFGAVTSPATGAGAFGFATSAPSLFSSPTGALGGGFGATFQQQQQQQQQLQQQQQQQQLMLAGPPPSVGQVPYGSFPVLPAVAEPKVGISARPTKAATPAGGGGMGMGAASIRGGSPLLSIRSTGGPTPRFGAQGGLYGHRGISATPHTQLALVPAAPPPAARP